MLQWRHGGCQAIEDIKQVKYRYLRALDTKHWDDFAETLTDDIVGDYGSSMGKQLHFTSRSELVEFMRSAMLRPASSPNIT